MKITIERDHSGRHGNERLDMHVGQGGTVELENVAVTVGSLLPTEISMKISAGDPMLEIVRIYDGKEKLWEGSMAALGGALRRLALFDKLESEFKQKRTSEAVAAAVAKHGGEQ
jgi:hypothetical protein